MKTAYTVLLTLLLFFLLHLPVSAAVIDEQYDALELDQLEQSVSDTLPGIDLRQGIDLDSSLGYLLRSGTEHMPKVFTAAVRSCVMVLAAVLFCTAAEGIRSGASQNGTPDVVSIVGALSVSAVSAGDVHSLIGMGCDTVDRINHFSKILLPTITAASAAAGSPGSGAARQIATLFFSDVLLTLITRLLLPLVYIFISASVGYAAIGNDGLKQISALLKWLITTTLKAVLLLFTGYLTMSGVISGTADAAALKAARFAVSSMVPVVGSILSDAAETVLAGAGMLKNTVGIFGMLAILGMCVIPFIHLGIHYIAYKIASVFSATVSAGRISGLVDDIGSAFGLVLGMTGTSALLLLISVVSAISAAVG